MPGIVRPVRVAQVCATMLLAACMLPSLASPAVAAGWTKQYDSYPAHYLIPTGIRSVDASHTWIFGNGVVLGTTDGGTSWRSTTPSYPAQWNDVDFVSADEGWAVGADGASAVIAHTLDGGATWSLQPVSGRALRAVDFYNARQGWAVGDFGTIRQTTDGGATWLPVTVAGQPMAGLLDVRAADPWNVWIGGKNVIWHSSTAGGTWSIWNYTGGAVNFTGVASFGNKAWLAGGPGFIWQTADGGRTWAKRSLPITSTIAAVTFTDASNGWGVGAYGAIVHTTNGGATWGTQKLPLGTAVNRSTHLAGISMLDRSRGWAVAMLGKGNAAVFKTTDGGGPTTYPVYFALKLTFAKSRAAHNTWVAASGSVGPVASAKGRTVTLQYLDGSVWRNFGTSSISSKGTFSGRVRNASRVTRKYRAYMPAAGGVRAGYSAVVSITWY